MKDYHSIILVKPHQLRAVLHNYGYLDEKMLVVRPPFNALMGKLKPQSNGSLYISTVIGALPVDGWAVTFGTARRGLGGMRTSPVPSSLYQM